MLYIYTLSEQMARSKHKVSSGSDTDDELVLVHTTPHPVMATKKTGRVCVRLIIRLLIYSRQTNTMEAIIQHQSPLKWADFNKANDSIPDPPPLPPVTYLLGEILQLITIN